MKRILCVFLGMLLLSTLIPSLPAFAAEDGPYSVGAVNAYPKANAITVYTPAYGASTGLKENVSALEIVVSADRITTVGGVDNLIPADGFVIAARGNAKGSFADAAVGDTVIFDETEEKLLMLNQNYNPYTVETISFNGYNTTRTADTIIIYNRAGTTTGTNIWGTEVTVGADGYVVALGGNNSPIPEGGFVISAVGAGRIAELTATAALGLLVTVNAEEKTVSFEYSARSIVGGMKVRRDALQAQIDAARQSLVLIDYDAAETVLAEMQTALAEAEAFSASDEKASLALCEYHFNKLYETSVSRFTESPAVEARALWLRPTGSETREKVNAIVKNVYEMGYNVVCLELLFNNTLIFPIDTQTYLFSQDPALNGFDVLDAYLDECHRYGMEVHGWMSIYRVGHDASTYPALGVGNIKKEWRCIAASGIDYVYNVYGNGHFLNPALPEVQEFLLKFYRYIFETYPLDGFQLDYVRYPYTEGEMYGYDDYTLEQFQQQYHVDARELKKSDALWTEWCKFRAAYVTKLVKSISELRDEIRPDLYLAADVAPDFREVYVKYMQEAEIWLQEGLIDVAYPMAYGTNVVPLYASYTVEAAGENAYSFIGVGDYGVDVYRREIEETRAVGADGFAFFSYAQYLTGNYKEPLASTTLSVRSLSPTFNSGAAFAEQCKTAVKKFALAGKTVTEDSVKEAISSYLAGDQAAFDAFLTGDESKDAILSAALKKAAKISALSRDTAKEQYYQTHPLPELYPLAGGETSGEDVSNGEETASSQIPESRAEASSEKSSSETEKNPTDGKNWWMIGGSAIVLLLAVTATVILFRRKKQ